MQRKQKKVRVVLKGKIDSNLSGTAELSALWRGGAARQVEVLAKISSQPDAVKNRI